MIVFPFTEKIRLSSNAIDAPFLMVHSFIDQYAGEYIPRKSSIKQNGIKSSEPQSYKV
jgi:hypothetical protein